MISFCTQGHGYFTVVESKLTEEELQQGLEEGKYLLAIIDEKILEIEEGKFQLNEVAKISVEETNFESFDFEVD